MVKIYLHGVHRSFCSESLLFRAIESLASTSIVGSISCADLIIVGCSGFYARKQPLWAHKIPKLRNYIISHPVVLKARPSQATLFYSSESPSIGGFSTSNCVYGISSELLSDKTNHFRLPYWLESMDWSAYGIRPSQTDRVGIRCKPADLTRERDGEAIVRKSLALPIFTSHLDGFRGEIIKRLSPVMPIRGYGRHFDPSIAHHSSSGFTKSQVLADYAFNLCPENTIYPGYVTEKILEAYISSTIPITVADPVGVKIDFNDRSLINLYLVYDEMDQYLKSLLGDPKHLRSIASEPLFNIEPSLDGFLAFLKSILEGL